MEYQRKGEKISGLQIHSARIVAYLQYCHHPLDSV